MIYTYDNERLAEAGKAEKHQLSSDSLETVSLQPRLLACFAAPPEALAVWQYFWVEAMPGLPLQLSQHVEATLNEAGVPCLDPYLDMLGSASLCYCCYAPCAPLLHMLTCTKILVASGVTVISLRARLCCLSSVPSASLPCMWHVVCHPLPSLLTNSVPVCNKGTIVKQRNSIMLLLEQFTMWLLFYASVTRAVIRRPLLLLCRQVLCHQATSARQSSLDK